MSGRNVISSDSHVIEPPQMWREYIDPGMRDRAPHLEHGPDSDFYTISTRFLHYRRLEADVFERFPKLKILSVENDIGWADRSKILRDNVLKRFSG